VPPVFVFFFFNVLRFFRPYFRRLFIKPFLPHFFESLTPIFHSCSPVGGDYSFGYGLALLLGVGSSVPDVCQPAPPPPAVVFFRVVSCFSPWCRPFSWPPLFPFTSVSLAPHRLVFFSFLVSFLGPCLDSPQAVCAADGIRRYLFSGDPVCVAPKVGSFFPLRSWWPSFFGTCPLFFFVFRSDTDVVFVTFFPLDTWVVAFDVFLTFSSSSPDLSSSAFHSGLFCFLPFGVHLCFLPPPVYCTCELGAVDTHHFFRFFLFPF